MKEFFKKLCFFLCVIGGIVFGWLAIPKKPNIGQAFRNVFWQPQVMAALIAVLGVALTAYISYSHFKKISYSTIHESTDWRKKLMDIASKKNIKIGDIYRIQASVNPLKQDIIFNKDGTISFDSVDFYVNEITKRLVERNAEENILQNEYDKNNVRKIARLLLKYNWEYNTKGLSENYRNDILSQLLDIKEHYIPDIRGPKEGLSFDKALVHMHNGHRISRKVWANTRSVRIGNKKHKKKKWKPTSGDILANDWYILDEN